MFKLEINRHWELKKARACARLLSDRFQIPVLEHRHANASSNTAATYAMATAMVAVRMAGTERVICGSITPSTTKETPTSSRQDIWAKLQYGNVPS
jgi:hypothetical protein